MAVAAPPDPQRVYLDYNATAPVLPVVAERMARVLTEFPGNPSSPHAFGQAARAALEEERARLADLLGVSRREVVFTSGGSEANTTVFRALEHEAGAHAVTSLIEHPSVLRSAEGLAERGIAVDRLPVDGEGVVDVEALPGLLRPETRLVSLMTANNETGVIQPVARLAELARAHGNPRIVVHTDAVQALGRIPLPLWDWGVDAATLAAHKLGGPKGVGALVLREGLRLPALVRGGQQERGMRAGTESLFLVAGFVAAAEWALERLCENARHMETLRERLVQHLAGAAGFFLNGAAAARLPNTLSVGFSGVTAQSLLVALDLAGIAVSTGSACSSGAVEPSHVLQAMGQPEARVRGTVRISLGPATTAAEIDRCAEVLRLQVARLRGEAGRRAS